MTGKIHHQVETNLSTSTSKELDNKRLDQQADLQPDLSSSSSSRKQSTQLLCPTDYGSLISSNQKHLQQPADYYRGCVGVDFRSHPQNQETWWKDKPLVSNSKQALKGSFITRQLNKMKNFQVNVRSLGVAFFVFASIFCLYYLWLLKDEKPVSRHPTKRLLMVNILNRHGDRK